MLSDSHLLRGYVENGSQDAFRHLVERHLPLVYRSALRQLNSDAHRAQDVTQMVFVALAQQARPLTAHTNLSAWLYSTTHRITCQTIRTEMRRRKREHVWAEEAAAADRGDSAVWSAIAPILDECLRALGTKDREAIVLRFFGNHSFAELGETLRIGEDAARMRVNRALEKLRQHISARGVSVTSTTLANALAADASLGAPAGFAATIASAAAHAVPGTLSVLGATAYIMSGSKLITSVAAAAAAISLGVATQQWSAARTTGSELESLRTEADSLRLQMIAAKRPARVAVMSSPRVAAQPAPSTDPWAAERAKSDQFLAAHPAVGEALMHSQRARIRGKYLPLYQELRLTEGQIAEFESLLLSASGKSWQGGVLFVGEHFMPDQRDARIRAVLGEEGFERYKAARLPGSGEAVVQQLASRLAFTDEPLASATANAVRDIFDHARATAGRDRDPWSEALPRLDTILTKMQMDEVNAIRARDRYQRAQAAAMKGTP